MNTVLVDGPRNSGIKTLVGCFMAQDVANKRRLDRCIAQYKSQQHSNKQQQQQPSSTPSFLQKMPSFCYERESRFGDFSMSVSNWDSEIEVARVVAAREALAGASPWGSQEDSKPARNSLKVSFEGQNLSSRLTLASSIDSDEESHSSTKTVDILSKYASRSASATSASSGSAAIVTISIEQRGDLKALDIVAAHVVNYIASGASKIVIVCTKMDLCQFDELAFRELRCKLHQLLGDCCLDDSRRVEAEEVQCLKLSECQQQRRAFINMFCARQNSNNIGGGVRLRLIPVSAAFGLNVVHKGYALNRQKWFSDLSAQLKEEAPTMPEGDFLVLNAEGDDPMSWYSGPTVGTFLADVEEREKLASPIDPKEDSSMSGTSKNETYIQGGSIESYSVVTGFYKVAALGSIFTATVEYGTLRTNDVIIAYPCQRKFIASQLEVHHSQVDSVSAPAQSSSATTVGIFLGKEVAVSKDGKQEQYVKIPKENLDDLKRGTDYLVVLKRPSTMLREPLKTVWNIQIALLAAIPQTEQVGDTLQNASTMASVIVGNNLHLFPSVRQSSNSTVLCVVDSVAASFPLLQHPSNGPKTKKTSPWIFVLTLSVKNTGNFVVLPPPTQNAWRQGGYKWETLPSLFQTTSHTSTTSAKRACMMMVNNDTSSCSCCSSSGLQMKEWEGSARLKVEVALRYFFPSEVAQYILAFALHDPRYMHKL